MHETKGAIANHVLRQQNPHSEDIQRDCGVVHPHWGNGHILRGTTGGAQPQTQQDIETAGQDKRRGTCAAGQDDSTHRELGEAIRVNNSDPDEQHKGPKTMTLHR